jgi:hypothetical protein
MVDSQTKTADRLAVNELREYSGRYRESSHADGSRDILWFIACLGLLPVVRLSSVSFRPTSTR